MKDSWFELMLNFFEKTITHLKEHHASATNAATDEHAEEHSRQLESSVSSATMPRIVKVQIEQLNSPQQDSVRVFTRLEQIKLTKASHQFLVRLASWGIISPETLELVINRLVFSDSRFVSLQETKWTVRTTLANGLNHEQTAFLDLILYQKEDQFPVH